MGASPVLVLTSADHDATTKKLRKKNVFPLRPTSPVKMKGEENPRSQNRLRNSNKSNAHSRRAREKKIGETSRVPLSFAVQALVVLPAVMRSFRRFFFYPRRSLIAPPRAYLIRPRTYARMQHTQVASDRTRLARQAPDRQMCC